MSRSNHRSASSSELDGFICPNRRLLAAMEKNAANGFQNVAETTKRLAPLQHVAMRRQPVRR